MKRIKKIINHSLLMVVRNLKNYLLLSVTITLSFTFLLAFFIFSDSNIYNKYKNIFKTPITIGEVMGGDGKELVGESITNYKYNILTDKLKNMDNTQYLQYFTQQIELNQYKDNNNSVFAEIFYIPKHYHGFYVNGQDGFEYIDIIYGRKTIDNDNEILIDENFYNILNNSFGHNNSSIVIPLMNKQGNYEFKEFKVVGVVSNRKNLGTYKENNGSKIHYISIYMAQDILNRYNVDYLTRKILVNSNKIEKIISICKELNINIFSSFKYQEEAKKEIANQIFIKCITVCILFTLLGINLYSSFNNALKERCFEIGVKRAIGASNKDIILQFFFEGIIIMVANIIISVFLVLDITTVYKLIQKIFCGNEWVIYITHYSILIFIFSSIFLSVSFSLVFAYQTTQVEIVKYLKSE